MKNNTMWFFFCSASLNKILIFPNSKIMYIWMRLYIFFSTSYAQHLYFIFYYYMAHHTDAHIEHMKVWCVYILYMNVWHGLRNAKPTRHSSIGNIKYIWTIGRPPPYTSQACNELLMNKMYLIYMDRYWDWFFSSLCEYGHIGMINDLSVCALSLSDNWYSNDDAHVSLVCMRAAFSDLRIPFGAKQSIVFHMPLMCVRAFHSLNDGGGGHRTHLHAFERHPRTNIQLACFTRYTIFCDIRWYKKQCHSTFQVYFYTFLYDFFHSVLMFLRWIQFDSDVFLVFLFLNTFYSGCMKYQQLHDSQLEQNVLHSFRSRICISIAIPINLIRIFMPWALDIIIRNPAWEDLITRIAFYDVLPWATHTNWCWMNLPLCFLFPYQCFFINLNSNEIQ